MIKLLWFGLYLVCTEAIVGYFLLLKCFLDQILFMSRFEPVAWMLSFAPVPPKDDR